MNILIAILMIVAAVLFIWFWFYNDTDFSAVGSADSASTKSPSSTLLDRFNSTPAPSVQAAPVISPMAVNDINFSRKGRITLKNGTPYLEYSIPGSADLRAELIFDTGSVCSTGTGKVPCTPAEIAMVTDARVQGFYAGGKLRVFVLDSFRAPAAPVAPPI